MHYYSTKVSSLSKLLLILLLFVAGQAVYMIRPRKIQEQITIWTDIHIVIAI